MIKVEEGQMEDLDLTQIKPATGAIKQTTKIDRAAYLANLVKLRSAALPEWMQSVRSQADGIVQELAIPSTRDEDWRFTDLSDLVQTTFKPVANAAALSFEQIRSHLIPEATNSRVVFVDGVYAPDLSSNDDVPEGVFVGSLAQAYEFIPQVANSLAKQPGGEEVFTALNTASINDGAIVWIPKNTAIEAPIHLLFIATGTTENLVQPRILLVAESSSEATVIEDYVSLYDRGYFTNSVAEVQIGDNAQIHHTRVQRDARSAFHIAKTAVTQGRDSHYGGISIQLGAALSRHNWEVYSQGEQSHTQLLGLSLVDDDRVTDTHSLIAFSKPYCTANQINKCIADDKSHGIFNGRICVPKLAQQTDAAQLSRSLLLSPKARIDTKPQLEIVADNVKCAHGATVSQLEDDAVFYLQSRGIDAIASRKLLTYAFATEIINQIPVDSVRSTLQQQARSVSES